jgi:nucleotide-binding universal stress UspA family protein
MVYCKRLVCCVDFSEFSGRALHYAAALARWYDATLTAVHAIVNVPVVDVGTVAAGGMPRVQLAAVDRDVVDESLRTFVSAHVPSTQIVDAVVIEAGSVGDGLLVQAAALDAEMMVIGTHGRSGFERLLLGSVAEKILRKASCPVLVVPRHAAAVPPGDSAPFTEIVCAIDFSASSARALAYALDVAQEADARMTLLHVIEMPPELRALPRAEGIDVPAVRAAAEADCLQRLRAAVPESAHTYCAIHTEVIEGNPAREIVRMAEQRGADLIVMGVQGRSAVDMLIFGSKTHAVLHHAPCPVLTVRT